MKKITLLLTLTISISLFAQNQTRNVNDVHLTYDEIKDIEVAKEYKNFYKFNSYKSQDGTIIKVGDTLYIGKPGVDQKQHSKYTGNVSVFSNIIIGKMQSALLTGMNYLPANCQGNLVIVDHLIASHTKASRKSPLYIGVFVRNPELGVASGRTIVDIDKALNMGEISSPNAPMSREEAIAKLKEAKDLYDLGLMEEADYLKMKEELTPLIMGK